MATLITPASRTPSARRLRALLCACGLIAAGAASAAGFGMGPGMMQGRMMGPGVAAPDPYAGERPPDARAARLLGYIDAQRLPCLQCHGVDSGR